MKWIVTLVVGWMLVGRPGAVEAAPVSFRQQIQPILRANCVACHKPTKDKGGLDVTTYAALMRGGKHGDTVVAGKPEGSRLIRDVSGAVPTMPEEGEPILGEELALLTRWIAEGAVDDTGAAHTAAGRVAPVYERLPAVSALAWSPAGDVLAVAAHREVLLFRDGEDAPTTRLMGDSARVESVAFSASGRLLAVSGGSPSEFGEIQLWDVARGILVRSIRTSSDVVHGVSFSDDEKQVAVGCADKLVRVFSVETGAERMRCDNHIDWVFATAFTRDGARVVSASRDRALKLIDVASGRLVDDVNVPRSPLVCVARHPGQDLVASGSVDGQVMLHRMEPRGGRLAEGDNKELSFVREIPRGSGSISAIAFDRAGELLAVVSQRGEARVFTVSDGKKISTLKTNGAPLFGVAMHPVRGEVAVAGMDGMIGVFDARSGVEKRTWASVPLKR
jgi:WD40 repeat protein/mono/diheme cytochrome c family protein